MSHVLVTSFEPFGGQKANSSLEVARALVANPPQGVQIEAVVLPVVAVACAELAWRHIEASRPDLVLALGQAGGSTHVRLEDRAINLDDFGLPDNAGQIRKGQPIVADGPAIEPAGVAIDQVLTQLRTAGFAVLHSLSAGRYVCNHLYYHLLHQTRRTRRTHGILFVHLPLLPSQIAAGQRAASQPLAQQVACVRAIVHACLGSPR